MRMESLPNAAATHQGGNIVLGSEGHWNEAAIAHEIGHAIMHRDFVREILQDPSKGYDTKLKKLFREKTKSLTTTERKRLESIKKQTKLSEMGTPLAGFPTAYAVFSPGELFSESYSMYIKSPKTLQKRAPDLYDYMRDEVFDGIEYTKGEYVTKGGKGSGHWGHKGRPGKRGGSAARGAVAPVKKLPPTDSKIDANRLGYNLSEKDKGVIRRAIKNLPQDHINKISGIEERYLPGTAGQCAEWTYVQLNSQKIYDRRAWNKGVVVHEIGHVVQHYNERYGNSRYKDDFRKFYREKAGRVRVSRKALRKEAQNFARAPRAGFPSTYSQSNYKELFAESYQMFTSAPKTLQKRSPEIYDYMKDEVFGGVEYMK